MGLFAKNDEESLKEIRKLTERLESVRGAADAELEKLDLLEKTNTLRKQIATLEIEKDKRTEEFEKREREIQHKVGLEQTRQKVELDQAKQQAELDVREKNLEKDQERFDKHMEFMEGRMTKEVDYVKDIAEKIMERLPHVEALVDAKRKTTKA